MSAVEIAPVTVAVDGTDAGRRALRYGVELAVSVGSPLRLVHVRHENIVLAPMMPLLPDPTLDEVAERVMSAAVAESRRLGWSGPAPEMVRGKAPRVPAIVEAARGSRCVVLGTRSSTSAHLFTGSTTNGVAAHADVPVVCVPEPWDPEVRFHKVAVGVACDPTGTRSWKRPRLQRKTWTLPSRSCTRGVRRDSTTPPSRATHMWSGGSRRCA